MVHGTRFIGNRVTGDGGIMLVNETVHASFIRGTAFSGNFAEAGGVFMLESGMR